MKTTSTALIVAALALVVGTARAGAEKIERKRSAKLATEKLDKTEDTVEGGTHWRIKTAHGAVHVWIPPGYDRKTAGTVVYVHGYYVNVDEAWKEYDLAKQFKASKQNAIFIVPEAPKGNEQGVFWPALSDLRKAVRKANIQLPDGPTVVIGHSGAYRTLSQWVDHHLVAEVILLDALYGKDAQFDDFIGTGKRAKYHKMILIGEDTGVASKTFAKKYPFAIVRDKLPDTVAGFTAKEKKAKLLYVRSQYGHMQIVTSGKVIPMLLRLTPLRERGDGAPPRRAQAHKKAAPPIVAPIPLPVLPPLSSIQGAGGGGGGGDGGE